MPSFFYDPFYWMTLLVILAGANIIPRIMSKASNRRYRIIIFVMSLIASPFIAYYMVGK